MFYRCFQLRRVTNYSRRDGYRFYIFPKLALSIFVTNFVGHDTEVAAICLTFKGLKRFSLF